MVERYTVILGSLTTSASAVPRTRHDDLGEAIRLVGAEQDTLTILLGDENGLATGNVVEPPASGEVNSPTVKDTGRRWFGPPPKSRPIGTNAARLNRKRAAALRWVWEYIGWNSLGAG